jgi:VanZ family protein
MRGIKRIVYVWGPAIMVMVLIFTFSSRQGISVSEELAVDFIVLKGAHIIMYAILYFLLFRAFYLNAHHTKRDPPPYIVPLIVAVVYGMSDEIHQTFVPTREGHIRDVFIDAIGIYIMYTLIKRNAKALTKLI